MGDNTQVFTDKVVTIGNVASDGSRDAFGIVMGSGFSGSSDEVNVVGDASGDLVITGNKEGGSPAPVYIVNGDLLAAYSTTSVDIAAIANVVIDVASLPELTSTPWVGTTARSSVANDIDGDGWGDIILGEGNDSLSPTNQGRLLILY